MDPIETAFQNVPREIFLPEEIRSQAHKDEALPIGYGQTNSQPYTVEKMLQWLELQPGDKVLDVGSGSGWTSALLAYVVGKEGHVYAVEKIPELVVFGRENCAQLGITNVTFFEASDTLGLPQHAPYNKILVSATTSTLRDEFVNQLSPGGKLVTPVRSTILEVTKTDKENLEIIQHPGFVFVPLVP